MHSSCPMNSARDTKKKKKKEAKNTNTKSSVSKPHLNLKGENKPRAIR